MDSVDSVEIEIRIEYIDIKLPPKTLKLDQECLIEEIIEFLQQNFNIKEKFLLYLDSNQTQKIAMDTSLEQLKLKPKQVLYAAQIKEEVPEIETEEEKRTSEKPKNAEEIEIIINLIVDGNKLKTLTLTSDTTTNKIIEQIREANPKGLSLDFTIEYITEEKKYIDFDPSISLFQMGLRFNCICDLNIINKPSLILPKIKLAQQNFNQPPENSKEIQTQSIAEIPTQNSNIVQNASESSKNKQKLRIIPQIEQFTQSVYQQQEPGPQLQKQIEQIPQKQLQNLDNQMDQEYQQVFKKQPTQSITQLFARESQSQIQQSEIFDPNKHMDIIKNNSQMENEDEDFLPPIQAQKVRVPSQSNNFPPQIELENPDAAFLFKIPFFSKPIDSYFQNIMMNERQLAIISEDEGYVIFSNTSQHIKTVLFKKDCQPGKPISIRKIDVEKQLIYKNVQAVFLKEKLGLVVFWKDNLAISRFFTVQI